MKYKKIMKIIDVVILITLLGAIVFFYLKADNWENLLSDGWGYKPELSNMSAILEYFKAFIKIFILSIVGIIYTIWRKPSYK